MTRPVRGAGERPATVREICLTVKCPVCGAVPDEECVAAVYDQDGKPLGPRMPLRQINSHEERYEVALAKLG